MCNESTVIRQETAAVAAVDDVSPLCSEAKRVKKYKQIATAKDGFSLISIMVAVVIIGILAVMAKPTVDSVFARARMAEAKNNLEFIKRAQEQRYLRTASLTGSGSGNYEAFSKVGYTGNGSHTCPTKMPETFIPGACKSLRYNYESKINTAGTSFEAVAVAPSDRSKYYIFVGCSGSGSQRFTYSKGDVWMIRNQSNPLHCRDILDFCPSAGGNAKDRCGAIGSL